MQKMSDSLQSLMQALLKPEAMLVQAAQEIIHNSVSQFIQFVRILAETADTMAGHPGPSVARGTPSLNINLNVCRILVEHEIIDPLTLKAALLVHPTTRHRLSISSIKYHYGDDVANVVGELGNLYSDFGAVEMQSLLRDCKFFSESARAILLAHVLLHAKRIHTDHPQEWSAECFAGYCTWLYEMNEAIGEIVPSMAKEIKKELEGMYLYSVELGPSGIIYTEEEKRQRLLQRFYELVETYPKGEDQQVESGSSAAATSPTPASHPIQSSPMWGQLLAAACFAAHAHRNQRRKGGEKLPYINHPLGVALILYDAGVRDIDVLVAAILHDVVEDCNVTFEELEAKFGKRVAMLVRLVTDNKADPKDKRKRDQIEHCFGMIQEGRLIKLADKIYNTEDLAEANPFGWSDKRCAGTLVWTYSILRALSFTNPTLELRLRDAIAKAGVKYGYPWLVQDGRDALRRELLEWYYGEMAREQAMDDERKRAQARGDAKAAALTPAQRLERLNKRLDKTKRQYYQTVKEREELLEEIARSQNVQDPTSGDPSSVSGGSSFELNRELSQSLKASRKRSAAAIAKADKTPEKDDEPMPQTQC